MAKYWTYAEMTEQLNQWEAEYPHLLRKKAVATSHEGRTVWLVTITDTVDTASEKPAVLYDANTHAGEVAGNAVAMAFIERLLTQRDQDEAVRLALQTRTFYVMPRLAVDGAEMYLTTPYRLRSSPRPYPWPDEVDGFYPEDVNGDGQILLMRIPSEDGAWKISDQDPRLMIARTPGETGGNYYHLLEEGLIQQHSETGYFPIERFMKSVRRYGKDFNRNYPIRWVPEGKQAGSGPYPLSEPETRAVVEVASEHENLCAYVALHTSGGVILRQPSTGADQQLDAVDLTLYRDVTEMGEEVTGYFGKSNFEAFSERDDAVLMPGAADDFMYEQRGLLAFTVEIWDRRRRAGVKGYAEYGFRHLMNLPKRELEAEELKLLAFTDTHHPEQGFYDWRPFRHPQLGLVEIGGWDPKFVEQNPPESLLPEECERVGQFLLRLALATPLLKFGESYLEPLADGLYRLVVQVKNAGYLPTAATQRATDAKVVKGLHITLYGMKIHVGQSPLHVGELKGIGQVRGANYTETSAWAEWVVEPLEGVMPRIEVHHPRAGKVIKSWDDLAVLKLPKD